MSTRNRGLLYLSARTQPNTFAFDIDWDLYLFFLDYVFRSHKNDPLTMSNSEALLPAFLRLPRELRDQIYKHVFETAPIEWLVPKYKEQFSKPISFPRGWTRSYGHDSTQFFHPFPALCCVSHQLFRESVPVFLTRVETFTFNTETCQRLLDWLAQFPDDAAFKAIKGHSSFEWNVFDSTSTSLHKSLLTRMSNLESLVLTFTFSDLAHSCKTEDHDWEEEQNLLSDFGIPYPFDLYYTPDVGNPDTEARKLDWPGDHEMFKNERRLLQEKLQEFVQAHRLEVVLDLAKLECLELQFDVKADGDVRHNLCRPLYLWFTKMWKEKGRSVDVLTGYNENE